MSFCNLTGLLLKLCSFVVYPWPWTSFLQGGARMSRCTVCGVECYCWAYMYMISPRDLTSAPSIWLLSLNMISPKNWMFASMTNGVQLLHIESRCGCHQCLFYTQAHSLSFTTTIWETSILWSFTLSYVCIHIGCWYEKHKHHSLQHIVMLSLSHLL